MTNGRTDPDRELAEARVADAAEARRQRRRQRELQIEESTMRGVLGGLADSAQSMVVVGPAGRRITGVITDVGLDLVLVETAAGQTTALRFESVVAVETPGPASSGSGSEPPEPSDRAFGDVVADLVGTGAVVSFQLSAGVHLDGEVLGVGQDVVIVRAGGSGTIYVALDSIYELAWSTSVG